MHDLTLDGVTRCINKAELQLLVLQVVFGRVFDWFREVNCQFCSAEYLSDLATSGGTRAKGDQEIPKDTGLPWNTPVKELEVCDWIFLAASG